MISPDKIFEDDRLAQLNFYINFLFLHENLKKTKEFIKFIENSKFDVAYFENNNSNQIITQTTHVDLDLSGMNINYLDEITSKNKNYSLSGSLSTIWNFFVAYYSSNNKKREINDSEIIIRKMNIHFNNIINQYTLISENIEKIFKSNEEESLANKKISDVFLFLKDSFIHLNNYDKVMLNYYEQTKILSERQIESVKKHVRRSKALTMLAVYLCLLPSALSAQTKIQADEFYSQGDYEEAIAIYSQLVEKPSVSADVYYNMGNAYYRLDSIARAILCYERALRLQPTDDDIRLNLQLARSKTVDKIAPEREMFFVTWYRAFVRLVSVDAWAYIALVSIALAAVLLLVFFFSYSERLRRLSFFASVTLIVVFLLANLFACQQQQSLSSHSAAIVITDVLPVKNIPSDDGSDEFTIHAGTKATITDNTMTDWKQLRLPDGRHGWVVASAIEMI